MSKIERDLPFIRGRRPKYVAVDKLADGSPRWRFRRPGSPSITLPGPIDRQEFWDAYRAAINCTSAAQVTKPRSSPELAAYVYFLRVGAHVKVGFSKDPLVRVATLKTGLPGKITSIVIVRGTMEDERALHRNLSQYRSNGEWFAFSGAVQKLMLKCAAAGEVRIDKP